MNTENLGQSVFSFSEHFSFLLSNFLVLQPVYKLSTFNSYDLRAPTITKATSRSLRPQSSHTVAFVMSSSMDLSGASSDLVEFATYVDGALIRMGLNDPPNTGSWLLQEFLRERGPVIYKGI